MDSLDQFVVLLLGDHLLGNELVGVLLEDGILLFNVLIHNGLGEVWLVDFIVSVSTVADYVNNYILFEGLNKVSVKRLGGGEEGRRGGGEEGRRGGGEEGRRGGGEIPVSKQQQVA